MLKRFLIIISSFLIIGVFVILNVHSFLSPIKPVANAKILVVDAWIGDSELKQAVEVYRAGNYTHVLVPGGVIDKAIFFPGMTGGDVSAVQLMYNGMPYNKVISLCIKPVKKDRTFQSALTVKEWMEKNNLSSCDLNLYTSCTHARRSWLLYKKAFKGKCHVGIIAARPVDYNARLWWKTSNGFRTVVDESIAYVYAFLFFHPNM